MDQFNFNGLGETDKILPKKTAFKTIALRGLVLFPGQSVHFEIGRDKSLSALERANMAGESVFLVAQRDAGKQNPAPEDLYNVGVLAKIQQIIKLPNETVRVLVTGMDRMIIDAVVNFEPFLEVELKPYPYEPSNEHEVNSVKSIIKEKLDTFFTLDHKIPKEKLPALRVDDTEKFIASAATFLFDKDTERQRILELNSEYSQLEAIYAQLLTLCDILTVEKNIAMRVRESVDKNQKEYYLREQIRAIHAELGDDEDEAEKIREQASKRDLPKYALDKIETELARLSKMAPNSPEAGIIRTYLEWLLDLPWNECTDDSIDLVNAQKILDQDHYGLEKVKERIIEYLAVHTLTKNHKGAILCFVGPPGVGKTSIVSSIARAAGRKFVQMSLGGVRDEAEIRGHRRTYIGAMPGRILSGMKTAGVNNPVFLLDEIDKMSSDFRGDPASAMLEVLDPNQNSEFKDHYLEIPYDLSQTMFVCTANTLDTIPTPLLDRMEVIELTGYTYAEKLQIAKRYLLPKQLSANGLKPNAVKIPDEVMMKIITLYTRESGVRNLEREISAVIRKVVVEIVRKKLKRPNFVITEELLVKYLGAPKFKDEVEKRDDAVGRVTGLAWTRVGGVTLDVEIALINGGKGEIVLTGSMGDVMKESAKTAISLIKSRASEYGIDPKKFSEVDIHIHIPEGATPKDGPSAGITLSTAILSAFTGKKVRGDVAMTGEITLLGRVLAIGGLKEKSLAALRNGVKTLIVPFENEKDIEFIPDEVKSSVEIKTVKTIDEVFDIAMVK
ncbi:MAG: endopeptidase La [Clostridia bacterium]|nr:endopeptidase La [Clostridia bacterium]